MSDIEAEVEVDRTTDEPETKIKTAIMLTSDGEVQAFQPRDTDELKSLVRVIIAGGCVPEAYLVKGTKKPDAAKMCVAILAGREAGLGPMASLRYIYIVRGAPAMWGNAVKAMVFKTGLVTDYTEEWIDAVRGEKMALPQQAVSIEKWPSELTRRITARRKGVETPFVGEFSVGDARRAGLWSASKKTYYAYPQDMLTHRAAARVWDKGFADCMLGLAIREIVEDQVAHEEKAKPDLAYLTSTA